MLICAENEQYATLFDIPAKNMYVAMETDSLNQYTEGRKLVINKFDNLCGLRLEIAEDGKHVCLSVPGDIQNRDVQNSIARLHEIAHALQDRDVPCHATTVALPDGCNVVDRIRFTVTTAT